MGDRRALLMAALGFLQLRHQPPEVAPLRRWLDPGAAWSHRDPDWQGLLERQPIQARQLLRKLLTGRLIYTPHEATTGNFYELTGQASYGKLLSGIAGQLRWCPRTGAKPPTRVKFGDWCGPR